MSEELKRGKSYTKGEIHDILDPDFPFYPYCGRWGIGGVIRFGERTPSYALFVTVGTDSPYYGKVQRITSDNRLIWCAPFAYGVGSKKIKGLLRAPRLGGLIYLFCRRQSQYNSDKDKVYTFIGTATNPEIIDDGTQPVVVKWDILGMNDTTQSVKELKDQMEMS